MIFGFLLFPDLEELDLVGPWEMVAMWSQYADGPEKCLMIADTKAPVRCSNGMIIQPHVSFDEAPRLDYLLIPGGFGTRQQVDDQRLIDFVSGQTQNCKAILSVCTGAFILHACDFTAMLRGHPHGHTLRPIWDFASFLRREIRTQLSELPASLRGRILSRQLPFVSGFIRSPNQRTYPMALLPWPLKFCPRPTTPLWR
jgi:putative intracellular protease/amidase